MNYLVDERFYLPKVQLFIFEHKIYQNDASQHIKHNNDQRPNGLPAISGNFSAHSGISMVKGPPKGQKDEYSCKKTANEIQYFL